MEKYLFCVKLVFRHLRIKITTYVSHKTCEFVKNILTYLNFQSCFQWRVNISMRRKEQMIKRANERVVPYTQSTKSCTMYYFKLHSTDAEGIRPNASRPLDPSPCAVPRNRSKTTREIRWAVRCPAKQTFCCEKQKNTKRLMEHEPCLPPSDVPVYCFSSTWKKKRKN